MLFLWVSDFEVLKPGHAKVHISTRISSTTPIEADRYTATESSAVVVF
jgi:hypothetical protein